MKVVKRDGKVESFDISKIEQAVLKSYRSIYENATINDILPVVSAVESELNGEVFEVEKIQDIVEEKLMDRDPSVAKSYILYRSWRTNERDQQKVMKTIMDGIVNVEVNDVNHENANMATETPAGQMMTFASTVTKDYAQRYLLNRDHLRMHKDGDIHIHDLDYYPTKTTTCVQYDLGTLFQGGFNTRHGWLREPQSIQSYATLATIVFQMNQNEQHGGQSIPAFDFFMAPGVYKTYIKKLVEYAELASDVVFLKEKAMSVFKSFDVRDDAAPYLAEYLSISQNQAKRIIAKAVKQTKKDTLQAMEAFVHNLNTMHSRGGNQVVFSSVNYGTDTSSEGRLVVRSLLEATKSGLGKGETPIFPIQVFKVKEGVNYSDADVQLAMSIVDDVARNEAQYLTPNFDLFLEACETTAKALFPNYVFLDTEFNKHELWQESDPERYKYEVATMGCRTRVFENLHGDKTSLGRGNISFTTINLPRLALLAKGETLDERIENFIVSVQTCARSVGEQLHQRYEYQRTALAKQFPFLIGDDIWKGGGQLSPNDQLNDVINSGTLGIGFIGGHNAMVALFGEGHGKNQRAYETLYRTVEAMNVITDELKDKYNLNYSVLATPAEGLSGRFTKLDRARFGVIPGVTDEDYYVNSFHIDVKENISISDKIAKEGPFHAITRGGHISYVELDGEAKQNMQAIIKVVKLMKDNKVGYGSINHPVDRCANCGIQTIIDTECPKCGSTDIVRMRRITGYLTGALDSWNSAKQAEERNRVKHH